MSFRRSQNNHDKWQNYCGSQIASIKATGLPDAVFLREDFLEEFLRSGTFQSGAQTLLLRTMPDPAFLALEKFIEPIFDFQQSYPALNEERFRRFKRYA